MKKIVSISILSLTMPLVSMAAEGVDAWSILGRIGNLLGVVMPILITLAVIYFIWGVIQYTLSGDEEKKKKARSMIIQGLIGLFVIVAFWGILSLITTTFGVGPEKLDPDAIPCIPNPAAGIECN